VVPLLSSQFAASKRISGQQCAGEWAILSDGLDFLKEKQVYCLAHIGRPNFSTQSIFTIIRLRYPGFKFLCGSMKPTQRTSFN